MVIGDFNCVSVATLPHETDAPLLVNPDAVLPCAVAREFLEMVRRRHTKVVQVACSVESVEAHLGAALNLDGNFAGMPTVKNFLAFVVGKAFDHASILPRSISNVTHER